MVSADHYYAHMLAGIFSTGASLWGACVPSEEEESLQVNQIGTDLVDMYKQKASSEVVARVIPVAKMGAASKTDMIKRIFQPREMIARAWVHELGFMNFGCYIYERKFMNLKFMN